MRTLRVLFRCFAVAGSLILTGAMAGCQGKVGIPVPGTRPAPIQAKAEKVPAVEQPSPETNPIDEPGTPQDAPPPEAVEATPPPPPPPPPPEFPAAARQRLVALGVRLTDRADGYGVDVRRNAKFGDDELEWVCESPLVVDLTMEGVLITHAGVEKLQRLPKLNRLILNDTPIGGKELETLAGQPLRMSLISLGLRGTQIRDDDLRWIKEFPALQRLDVSSTVLTDACLAHLEDVPLLALNVTGTQVTAEGLAQLRTKNPKLMLRQ